MSLAAQLWQDHRELAIACLQHPFVQGISTGSLAKVKFAYYVGQDAFFLQAFARAYSIAAAKAPDLQGLNTFHRLVTGVLQELQLHESYADQWGIDLTQVKPGVATHRYTDFLLATAWSSEVGLIAAAMVPCMRLYAFLGEELARVQPEGAQHAYRDWIRTYSSPEFQVLPLELEALVDRYGTASPQMAATYSYAMLCERDFFTAAWEA